MVALCEFRPVDVAHVARREEFCVEGKRRVESVGCLASVGAQLEVVAEQFAVDGVGTVVDDYVGAFHRVESAEVGDALVGYDDVDRVFGVVDVRNHGDDV